MHLRAIAVGEVQQRKVETTMKNVFCALHVTIYTPGITVHPQELFRRSAIYDSSHILRICRS